MHQQITKNLNNNTINFARNQRNILQDPYNSTAVDNLFLSFINDSLKTRNRFLFSFYSQILESIVQAECVESANQGIENN